MALTKQYLTRILDAAKAAASEALELNDQMAFQGYALQIAATTSLVFAEAKSAHDPNVAKFEEAATWMTSFLGRVERDSFEVCKSEFATFVPKFATLGIAA